jgi:hypothetical protein
VNGRDLSPDGEHRIRGTAAETVPPAHASQIPMARGPPSRISRGFLPWTLSDDGPSSIVPMGRHPKTFTKGAACTAKKIG